MKFVTAVLFLLGAAGLYYISRAIQNEDEIALVALPGISVAIFVITFTLLIGRVIGSSTGIENLFVLNSGAVDPTIPLSILGYPSIFTTLNFILFGVINTVAIFPGALRERLVVTSGYIIATVGMIATLGYVFNIPDLYYYGLHSLVVSATPMTLNTALIFILLGVGLAQIRKPESLQ
jgi:hypothetical protein